MGRIIASTNVTIDGSVCDPTGEEGRPGGGWFGRIGSADHDAFGRAALEEARAAGAFLMGRHTYEFLASRWPDRTGPLAERLGEIDKFVVSATLAGPAWRNRSQPVRRRRTRATRPPPAAAGRAAGLDPGAMSARPRV